MATVLVVDDTELDRFLAGSLLEENPDWSAVYAEDGKEALILIRREAPDLVLTDLQMPEINGLELVETIRREFPAVPVILMTAHGSEEIAVAALQKGAASYVPKKNLARDLVHTVDNVLKVARAHRNLQQVMECLAEAELQFLLANDPIFILPLISHLQDLMLQMRIVDRNGLIRVGTALHEALINAIEHGNLELTSELRESGDYRGYLNLVEQRRRESPFRDRRIRITAKFTHQQAEFVIGDDGQGFDPAQLPDPTDPANLEKMSGRGLFLVRTFMDEVRFNATGNEITMIKRCQ